MSKTTTRRWQSVRLVAEGLEARDVPANLYVAPTGIDAAGRGTSPSAPFRTIQAAVNAAANGDLVLVAAGTYTYDAAQDPNRVTATDQVVEVFDKSLAIVGGFSTADAFAVSNPQANPTVIDGEGKFRGLYLFGDTQSVSFTLRGVTVRNGFATGITARTGNDRITGFGGGMFVDMLRTPNNPLPIVFQDVTFENNKSVGSPAGTAAAPFDTGGSATGGGLFVTKAGNVQLTNVVFRNNQAIGGNGGPAGGRALGGALHTNFATVTATNVTFDGNKAIGGTTDQANKDAVFGLPSDATGGAIAMQLSSTGVFTNVTIVNSQAVGGATTSTAAGSEGGGGYGGAVFAEEDTALTFRDAVIADNLAQGASGFTGGLAGGGGIAGHNIDLTLDRVKVLRNRALAGGRNTPAGRAAGGTGGGVYVFSTAAAPGSPNTTRTNLAITNSVLADNRTEVGAGGDVGTGGGGGGLRVNGMTANVSHTTIANNSFDANLFFGEAILIQNDGGVIPTVLNLTNSIVANHKSVNGKALTVFNGATANLANNIFFGNANNANVVPLGGGPNSTNPGVINGAATNLTGNPLFTAPGAPTSDYTIQAGSAAVNAAVGSSAAVDLANRPRAGTPDVGAYELGSPNTLPAVGTATGANASNPFTPPPPPPPPPPGTVRLVGVPPFAVGSDAGGTGDVQLRNPDQSVRFTIAAFPGFTGGVRTAVADFNGDGTPDVAVGTGPGRATRVRVISGADGTTELFAVDPFEAAFTGGVYVAAGDVTGDGKAELVITPDEGGGPRVRVFSGAGFTQLDDFFGIDDPNFRGGARAAVGDINGDGRSDLLVAAGFGGGPRLAAFNGAGLGAGTRPKLFGDFFAFENSLRNGVFPAVGDVDGDNKADVIAGGGPGGGPRVRGLSGAALVGSGIQTEVANFFGGDVNSRGGARVAVKNLDGDNRTDIVVGAGTGAGSRVTAYLGKNTPASGTPPEAFALDAFSGFTGGVFVG